MGIGTDIYFVEGIERSFKKRGDLFATTYCTTEELHQVKNSKDPSLHLTKILCAKECFGKAIGTGLVPELWWDDIGTYIHTKKSEIFLSDGGRDYMTNTLKFPPNFRAHLSLSNRKTVVSGVCVIST